MSDDEASKRPGVLATVFAPAKGLLEEVGTLADLAFHAVVWGARPPYRVSLVVTQMEFVGVQSIFLVGLVGLFTGMVFAVQTVYGFRRFGAENMVGGVVALTLSREMAPVLTAIMVAARAGSGMAAELGNMRSSEQIDALETMAVNPVQYLVVPRIIAGIVMVPVLALVFFLIGVGGSWAIGVWGMSRSWVDLAMLAVLGFVGYLFRCFSVPIAPALIGLILGPMAELQLRRALAVSQGDPSILVTSPVSAALLAAAALLLALPLVRAFRSR